MSEGMQMIILITYEVDGIEKVSHGVDFETMRNIVMPGEMTPNALGAVFFSEMGEWVILD